MAKRKKAAKNKSAKKFPKKRKIIKRVAVKKIKKTKKKSVTKKYALNHVEKYLNMVTGGLLAKNLNKYNNASLEQHYKSELVKNEFGEVYIITNKIETTPIETNHQIVNEKLLYDLKSIKGIASITEANLRKVGYKSISDLVDHMKYKEFASAFVSHVQQKNGAKLYEQLSSRGFTGTNPAYLYNSTYFNLSNIAVIDIETLGLHDCPLFLIGLALFEDNHIKVIQIFADHLRNEKAALHYLFEYVKTKEAIFSFNGKSFDIPFIRKRLIRHDLTHDISHPHFDMKYLARSYFKDEVSDYKLQTLENEVLNFSRGEDVPGDLVPLFYQSFVKTKNIGTIIPIIDHNKQDLISTINVYRKLHELSHN